jgi:hypothetical protein
MVTGSSSDVAGAAVYNCTTNVPPTEGCNATSPSEVENVERSSWANYGKTIRTKLMQGIKYNLRLETHVSLLYGL